MPKLEKLCFSFACALAFHYLCSHKYTQVLAMTIKEFFGKLTSKIIWVNLLAMFLIIVAIAVGIWIGLERYTMHGWKSPCRT